MEDLERERLYRQGLAGDRARVVLEELGGFLCKQEESILARLAAAETPDAAFALACEYRATTKFASAAKAAVSSGDAAARTLLKE